jgi:hypothetical protein
MILAGSSGCGKTYLIEKMLSQHRAVFEKPIVECVFAYRRNGRDDALFKRLTEAVDFPITFHEGFPALEISENNLFNSEINGHKVLICDDLLVDAKRAHKVLTDTFCVLSRHCNFSCIVTIQSLNMYTPAERACMNTLLRNSHYVIIFVERRTTSTVKQLAANFYPGETWRLLKPFHYIQKAREKHSYLVIDFATPHELLEIREGGCTLDDMCYGFAAIKGLILVHSLKKL